LAASPSIVLDLGVKPWLGTLFIDSAALDIPKLMKAKHHLLYDDAFGNDGIYWKSVSPFHLLKNDQGPF